MRASLTPGALGLALVALLWAAGPAAAQDGLAVRAEAAITMDPAAMAEVVDGVARLADGYGFAVRVDPAPDGAVTMRMHLVDMTVLATGGAAGGAATLHFTIGDGPFEASERKMADWLGALGTFAAAREGLEFAVVQPPVVATGQPRAWLPPIAIVRIGAEGGKLLTALDAVAAFGEATGLAVRETPESVGGLVIQMFALDMSVIGVVNGSAQNRALSITVADGAMPASADGVAAWLRDLSTDLARIPALTVDIEAGR